MARVCVLLRTLGGYYKPRSKILPEVNSRIFFQREILSTVKSLYDDWLLILIADI